MSLVTPILLNVPAFDATENFVFKFDVTSGSQVVANKLVVRRNDNNSIVYQNQINSFVFEHLIPANSLTNDVYYNASLTTFDSDGNESQPSNSIQFYCFLTPTVVFSNLPSGNIIENASFNVEITYDQVSNEKLNSYEINLYNSSKVLLSSSGLKYVEDGTPPIAATYLLSGLDNNTQYYLKAIVQTVYNTIVETDFVEINVSYIHPSYFSTLQLANNCLGGYIVVNSNLKLITGTSNPSPPLYINGSEVDLTAPNSEVTFGQGYRVDGDFTLKLWFRKPNVNTKIIEFSNANGDSIEAFYREGYENANDTAMKSYLDVYVQNVNTEYYYYIYSNYIDILGENDYFVFWLRRINNIYQAELGSIIV